MKIPLFLFFTGLVTLLAADAANASGVSLGAFQSIIPLLVPAAIAGLKFIWPSVPRALLPFLAPVLGALAEIAATAAGRSTGDIYLAAGLGAAGVWLREAYDQTRKMLTPPLDDSPLPRAKF